MKGSKINDCINTLFSGVPEITVPLHSMENKKLLERVAAKTKRMDHFKDNSQLFSYLNYRIAQYPPEVHRRTDLDQISIFGDPN